jgi:ABC-2 type transport system ATP-binding protein
MEEADYLCGRIAIIDHGNIIALDTPDKLKNSMGGDIVDLETEEKEKLREQLKFDWIRDMKILEKTLRVTVINGEKAIPDILAAASQSGIKINSVNLKKPTLEDVFISYTGRSIREEEASPEDRMRQHMKLGMRR